MKVGDLVKFVKGPYTGEPQVPSGTLSLGIVVPPTEGMSRYWTNTTEDDMVNVFWSHLTGLMPYRKDYLEVVE